MAGIRVRLQFPDEEKYWIYLDYAHTKTVQDVVSNISEKFSVSCDKLLLDDAQLPLKESVFVIKETDLLRVHLKNKKKRKAESPVPENITSALTNSNKDTKKRRKKAKDEETQLESDIKSTNIQLVTKKEKKKKITQEPSQLEEVKSPITAAPEPDKACSTPQDKTVTTELKDKHAKKLENNEKKKSEELQVETNHNDTVSNQTLENNICDGDDGEKTKQKRRRRKRKSHYTEQTVSTVELRTNQPEPPPPVDYVPYYTTDRKHIRFDAVDEMGLEIRAEIPLKDHIENHGEKPTKTATNATAQKIKAPVQLFPDEKFNPFFQETSRKQNNSVLQPKQAVHEKPDVPAKTSTPRNTNKPHNGSSEISQFGALLSLRSAVFTRNASSPTKPAAPTYNNVPPPQSIVNGESANTSKAQTVDEPITVASEAPSSAGRLDVTKFPLFPGPPRIDDVIAFKILELSDNYNPEISEYIIGRVSAIDAVGQLTIELKEPRAKRHAFGKFELYENQEDDEEEMQEVEMETTMSCQWNQMIEPRLIFP